MNKLVFGFGLACAACSMAATEITFTGADTANPTNLASAANWSAAPGADTVGVIDLAQTSALGYVVTANLELSGLRIRSNSGKAVTIGGAGTMTLGADGYASGAKGNVTFKCPLATSADQAWNAAGAQLNTYSTLTGTSSLLITNVNVVAHAGALKYDGRIDYRDIQTRIIYSASGKWAKDVYYYSKNLEFKTSGTNVIKWGDVFPSGCALHQSGNLLASVSGDGLGGKVLFSEGDSFTTTAGYTQVNGYFEQDGGTIKTRNNYPITLGWFVDSSRGSYYDPCHYLLKGGTLTVMCLDIGYKVQNLNQPCRFEQTGGTMTTAWDSNQGGGLAIAPGGQNAYPYSTAEYLMGGGTLNLLGSGGSDGLALCSQRGSGTLPAALFTQTGGVVHARYFRFGSARKYWNETASVNVTSGYGRFELAGGTFSMEGSTDSSFVWSPKWNAGGAAGSNSVYSMVFRGGTMKLPRGMEMPVSACFPAKASDATSWGSDNRTVDFAGPVWGGGTIRKDGTDTLFLHDATRFTGTVDVRAGHVEVPGTDAEPGDDCYRWTADSLVSTHADGDAVTSWADANHGFVASTNESSLTKLASNPFGAPTFKANAFNGHAAVRFEHQTLATSKAENPLFGRTKFSVVVVFKPELGSTGSPGGANSTTTWYCGPLVSSIRSWAISSFTMGICGNDDGSSGCRIAVGRNPWSNQGGVAYPSDLKDKWHHVASRDKFSLLSSVHAAAVSIEGGRIFMTVDGFATNHVETCSTPPYPVGYGNQNWAPSDNQQFNIGAMAFGDGKPQFKGQIAEIRVYTNRVLTASEQRGITLSLLEKYDGTAASRGRAAAEPTFVKSGASGSFASSYTVPTPVAATASWDADALGAALADGAEVGQWTSADGTRTAVAGTAAPKFSKGSLNGHDVVRFNAANKESLGLPAQDSPLSGANSFTVACVWRTVADSADSMSTVLDYRDYPATGILSTRQPSAKKVPDFELSYRKENAIAAAYGNETADQFVFSRKPCRLNDGEPHVTVVAFDASAKTYKLMTDGVFVEGTLANASVRGAYDLIFGAGTASSRYFTGDLAAVRIYDSALTKGQMRDLGEYFADRYGFQLLIGYKCTSGNRRAIGLGATNVTVAAGASFAVPVNEQSAAFSLKAGATLSGAGDFLGSYGLTAGATLDITAACPSFFDDLQISGGTIRASKRQSSPMHVRRLAVGATATVDLTAGAEPDALVRKLPILTYDEAEIDPDAEWSVVGVPSGQARIVVDAERKTVFCKFIRGMLLIVR